jgi:hypothetical protein
MLKFQSVPVMAAASRRLVEITCHQLLSVKSEA